MVKLYLYLILIYNTLYFGAFKYMVVLEIKKIQYILSMLILEEQNLSMNKI